MPSSHRTLSAGHLAAAALLPLLAANAVASSSSRTTCATGSNGTVIGWWNTKDGDSPCAQFESLYRQCDPSFRMFDISSSVNYVCEPDQNPSDFCCCSSASFTLFQACRFCQAGSLPSADDTTPDQTYGAYLHSCPAATITNSSLASNLSATGLASWVFRPVPASGVWDYAGAQANATREGVWKAASAGEGMTGGAKAGVAVAVIVIAIIGAFLFVKFALPRIRRRRVRQRGDEDFEVSDAGYKSWYGPPSSGTGGKGWRGSVAGYFAGAAAANASRRARDGDSARNDGNQWNEMKDEPSSRGGKETFTDVYPLSGSAATFGQSSNPFTDPNNQDHDDDGHHSEHTSKHTPQQEQEQRHPSPYEPYAEDVYVNYQIGDDDDAADRLADAPDATTPRLEHAAEGWQEREGESDWDRQRRWEDEGRAGNGAGHHARDKSFGGGGEHGDGMYPVAI